MEKSFVACANRQQQTSYQIHANIQCKCFMGVMVTIVLVTQNIFEKLICQQTQRICVICQTFILEFIASKSDFFAQIFIKFSCLCIYTGSVNLSLHFLFHLTQSARKDRQRKVTGGLTVALCEILIRLSFPLK